MKTIVNIVSDQLAPNYLFIKELYKEGDELLFIATKRMEGNLTKLLKNLSEIKQTSSVIFENDGDEEKWDVMVEKIDTHLNENNNYIVNLSGGTKYMSHVIMNIFEQYNSSFYYIPFPKNIIIEPKSNKIIPINYRMKVEEYLGLYGREIKCNSISQSIEYTEDFYNMFTNNLFSENDYSILEKLRKYRDNDITISNIENKIDIEKKPAIPGLKDFLTYINFPLKNPNKLNHYECRYITGGWFEEYAYHLIKRTIKPNDMQLGVETRRNEITNLNDLDVTFTLGNKLYIIECKTGVGKESLLKEIVYKASALKSYLTGLGANSYIFTLSPQNTEWATISRNLGATYWGREYFTNEENWKDASNKIIKSSYDR